MSEISNLYTVAAIEYSLFKKIHKIVKSYYDLLYLNRNYI